MRGKSWEDEMDAVQIFKATQAWRDGERVDERGLRKASPLHSIRCREEESRSLQQ